MHMCVRNRVRAPAIAQRHDRGRAPPLRRVADCGGCNGSSDARVRETFALGSEHVRPHAATVLVQVHLPHTTAWVLNSTLLLFLQKGARKLSFARERNGENHTMRISTGVSVISDAVCRRACLTPAAAASPTADLVRSTLTVMQWSTSVRIPLRREAAWRAHWLCLVLWAAGCPKCARCGRRMIARALLL